MAAGLKRLLHQCFNPKNAISSPPYRVQMQRVKTQHRFGAEQHLVLPLSRFAVSPVADYFFELVKLTCQTFGVSQSYRAQTYQLVVEVVSLSLYRQCKN